MLRTIRIGGTYSNVTRQNENSVYTSIELPVDVNISTMQVAPKTSITERVGVNTWIMILDLESKRGYVFVQEDIYHILERPISRTFLVFTGKIYADFDDEVAADLEAFIKEQGLIPGHGVYEF